MDSLERALDALPVFEGAAQDASREACASLEDGDTTRRVPNANQVVSEAPVVETTLRPPLQARRSSFIIPDARKARLLDRLTLGSYVKPMKWGCPSVDMLAPSLAMWDPFLGLTHFGGSEPSPGCH